MKVQKDNDRRKGLVKCIEIIYIWIIFYLTSIINITRRFHYFLVALFRSVGVELVIPGLSEDIIGVVFNVWICSQEPEHFNPYDPSAITHVPYSLEEEVFEPDPELVSTMEEKTYQDQLKNIKKAKLKWWSLGRTSPSRPGR